MTNKGSVGGRLAVHIVDSDSRSHAQQALTAVALGHHPQVYSGPAELLARPPRDGVVLLHERMLDGSLNALFQALTERGVWLPVIVCAEEPQIEQVADAIKDGALDYLQLPLDPERLARSLARVGREAEAQRLPRYHVADVRRRIALLSRRERQVLELLSEGNSNKEIARLLEISPRTVEIHRANMMTKLQAGRAAQAVRLWLQSGL